MELCSCPRDALCDDCRSALLQQLRGVAGRNRRGVEDLTRDERLREQLRAIAVTAALAPKAGR